MQHAALVRLLSRSRASVYPLPRCTAFFSRAAGAGDPSVHSEDPQGFEAELAAQAAEAEQRQKEQHKTEDTKPPHTFTDRTPPTGPSHKLESHEVVPPDPTYQQKRKMSHAALDRSVLEEVPCVGPDGRPLVQKGGEKWEDDTEEREEDYKEYYKDHKPSPLSEVKFADTRKPITQAIDAGTAYSGDYGLGMMVDDTVDESLARAEKIFWERARMGIPELPHSQVLARMLRERGQQPPHGSV